MSFHTSSPLRLEALGLFTATSIKHQTLNELSVVKLHCGQCRLGFDVLNKKGCNLILLD